MSDTDAYRTPSSKLAGSEGKLMVLSCNRIAAGTLLKMMILGSFVWLGLLIYSRFFDIKVTVVRSKAQTEKSLVSTSQ